MTAKISSLLKKATLENNRIRELEHLATAKTMHDNRLFEPKTEDTLAYPSVKHKKPMFPYELPELQTADEIDISQQLIDNDFIDL